MYFQDLSAYRYYLQSNLSQVLNVGWIDSGHSFGLGEAAPQFVRKLAALIAEKHPDVDVHVNRLQGIHACNLCGEQRIPLEDYRGRQHFLGMSEIWIPADGLWYAAPSMVLHYIETHRYLPPSGFVEAVERMSVTDAYNAQDVYDRLVQS